MKNFIYLCFALLLSACFGTSKPSQFYTLKSIPSEKAVSTTTVSIGVEEARIARYLDKPQIILSEESGVELRISELNRWAEPLSSLIQRTLVDDLSSLLPKASVKSKNQAREKFNYTIFVEINHMDGIFNQSASLEAWYSLINANGDIIGRYQISLNEPLADSYLDYVNAQSKLIQKLAQHIAQKIASLPK